MVQIQDKAIMKVSLSFTKKRDGSSRLKMGHTSFSRDMIVSLLEQQGLADKHGVLSVNPSTFDNESSEGRGFYLALCETDAPGLLLASMFLAKQNELEKKSQDALKMVQEFSMENGQSSSKLEKEINSVQEQARTEIKKVQVKYMNFMEGKRTMNGAEDLVQTLFDSLSNICSLLLTMGSGQ
jgi:hypothetical protein